MIKSIPSSPIALAAYMSATGFVLGGLFILAVTGGRELRTQLWLHQEAIVLNTYSLCEMWYGKPPKGGAIYIETIKCEGVPSYVDLYGDKCDHLGAAEIKYVSLGYASLGLDSKPIRLRAISLDKVLNVGSRFEILVNPRSPKIIDRLSTDGEFSAYCSWLSIASVTSFLIIWGLFTFCELLHPHRSELG